MSSTILLVEDTLDLARVVQRELENEGYRVIHATTGRQALALHEREHPDLLILDWMLPEMDGLAVLRQLRGDHSFTPVLMLTARSEEIDRVVGLEVGADDYLSKPFSMRELLARVHALLRRVDNIQQMLAADKTPQSQPQCYGPLHLDPGSYRVTLDGAELDLTRTEFDLLALLMRSPGRAFSRMYLLEAVWGGNYVAGDRSVDNAVLRLRKKLGALGDAVETVWGVGYRLKPL
jgi:two-component system, OmpR family, response regulator